MLCKCLVKIRKSIKNDISKPRKDRLKHYRSRAKAINAKRPDRKRLIKDYK